MAARLKRGVAQPAKAKKSEYIEKLERALRDYHPEGCSGGMDVKQEGKERKGKEVKGKGPQKEKGKVLGNVLDKMRGGLGKGEQQEATQDKLYEYEVAKKKLRRQNESLAQIAEHIQDKAVVNSRRFEIEVTSLNGQLQQALNSTSTDTITSLITMNEKIKAKIASLRGAAEQYASEEKQVMEEAFVQQITAKTQDLEDERRTGKNKTGEWVSKNKKLQEEVNKKLIKTEAKHTTSKKLLELNKGLLVEHRAQEEDKVLLMDESKKVRDENLRLKNRITHLESHIFTMQTSLMNNAGASRTNAEGLLLGSLQEATDLNTPEHLRLGRYEEALQRVNSLLDIERNNVKGVRAAHLAALSQRTELEVYLKESITAYTEAGSTITEEDRRAVIEHLLSKERVLQLFYGDDVLPGTAPPPPSTPPPELDMNDLWERWKTWTEDAKAS
eukprot:TRINITY_DN1239_c0_g2_i1.p1 TRINITY_DN1239_c0_g2~~TRINITY_DN1239_c0_g2_i1.p1  ORF type:complete len:457 (+),score=118.44 TRINITY_DN1239_c0_g2_i1:44-1372(+)